MSPLSGAIRSALVFSLTGVAGFSLWAFAGRRLGETLLYLAITAVFLVLPPLLLGGLLSGQRPRLRFALVFIPAFIAYAAVWCLAWFSLKSKAGEWLGSVGGCAAFAGVSALFLGGGSRLPGAFLVLFLAHSAGYFAGDQVFTALKHSQTSMLLWGLLYGAGFGAGVGWVFRRLDRPQPV